MAAPAIVVERFRVEHGAGFTMSVVNLVDRRAAGNRVVRFVFQRHLEAVLYGRIEGSSGPIWKLMNQTGMSSTTLAVSKQSITDRILTDAEYDAIMTEFKASLPSDMVDPCSLGRIRHCTILPIAAAATVVRNFGRSGAAMAWLRAFDQPIPQAWELREEQEANEAAGEADLLLNEQLDELGFEAEDISFADELKTMAVFSNDTEDEERLKTYILERVPPALKSELDTYILHRTATFAARRQGGAVQSISAEADRTALLRFFGYMVRLQRLPEGAELSLKLLCRPDLGDLAQAYATWLQTNQQCKFSTIANYINGLVSITTYAYATQEPPAAVLALEPNPLTQLIYLRGHAEKESKTQHKYEDRKGGWIEWDEVQKARVAALEKLRDAGQTATHAAKRSLLRDAAAISLLSLIPPDRVGIIRKLRLQHTLKRKDDGGWMMDLSRQRDGHKTSRFYGPFAASLPDALTPILNQYATTLELEVDGDTAYLFHPPQGSLDRAMESAAWSGWVKRLFKRHHGEEIAPKTLRSAFITWLRNQTTAPEVLKSAAHAMKHSEARQGSADYDQLSDDRLVKAAYDFNLAFAAGFTATASSSGEGSSADAPPPPPPQEQQQPPPPPPPQPQQPNVDTQQLPPVAIKQLTSQLIAVGFARSSADNNGDCYPLSAMAGFEITAAAARNATVATTAKVRQVREGAIGKLTGAAAIDGVDAAVFRAGERLPGDAAAAAATMAPWLASGFWFANDGNKSGSFQLGVAMELGRPVAVLEKRGRAFLDPVKVYGARTADGTLMHTETKPGAPETIPTYTLKPMAKLLDELRANPIACSVVEYNGSNHFNPWILKPVLRKAAMAAKAETVTAASEPAAAAAASAAIGDLEAAEEDEQGEWVALEGAPFTAHLVRGGPRTTAPTRNYAVTIPFGDETPIYSGGKVKFPIVPGAPADGFVCMMPLVPPVAAKELTFTLKLDRAGATADSVTINSALYWKKTTVAAEAEAGLEAELEAEAEPEPEAEAAVDAAPTAAVALLAQEPPLGDAQVDAEAAAGESNALAWLQPGCCGEPGSTLLFLDVDGVLNKGIATYADPAALTIRGWPHALDIELLHRLKSVLTQSGAAIVLSSAWRDNDLGKRLLARGFAAVGISCDLVVGATPLQGASRVDEIKAWLANHAPECQHWVAVDDMDLLADAPELGAHVVRTSTDAGLTADAAEECVAKLAAPPPPGSETEAAMSDQLGCGDRFVVVNDPRNPFAIATVVAVNTDATNFIAGGNGETYHVRITQFESAADLQAAAEGLGQRNLADCHVAGVDLARPPPRSSSRPRKRPRLSHPPSQEAAASHPAVPLPTIVDDADHSDLTVGQSVIAFGRSPNGQWTQFHAIVKGFRERAPHIVVRYTSDVNGNPIRIGLPSPVVAHISRSDIEVLQA